jgi:DNA-binding XRE family transcriptional regulator
VTPVRASLLLSFLASLLAVLVWQDNRPGFRDAGSMADLIAATFAMISAIWLVCAVFMQRTELQLQREELALQREELARLAEASEDQNQIMLEQGKITFKADLANIVQGVINSQWSHIAPQLKIVMKTLAERCLAENPSLGEYADHRVRQNGILFYFSADLDNPVHVSYVQVFDGIKEKYQVQILVRLATLAVEGGQLSWFSEDLPFTISMENPADAASLYIVLNAVAAGTGQ